MKKDFLKMTYAERDAEVKKWEKGLPFSAGRPLSGRSKALWELAKRGPGRPAKPDDEKAARVLISMSPELLARAKAFAHANGLDQSKLFALSVQAFIASDEAHRQAFTAKRAVVEK